LTVEEPYRSVLVTGASGYIGRLLIEALCRRRGGVRTMVASDVRPISIHVINFGLE
jgi:nucleoside-diphosphate-sugar epimerase